MTRELRFTPRLFDFLRELKQNNNRDWFEPNKQRYIDDVRDPLQAFIAAMGPRLHAISPHLVADPKKSIFRIYRDVRFSKNKAPYKTAASCYFFHQATGKDGAGIYLHLEPAGENSMGCFLGVGSWQPDPVTRTKITDAISAKSELWECAVNSREFRKLFKLEGGSMAKLPRKYDPAHSFATDLMRKDFIGTVSYPEKQAVARDFIDRIDTAARAAAPFLGFLFRAMGQKF